jgi:hypothetical protein
MYSLIVTAKLNDVNPRAWLAECCPGVAARPSHPSIPTVVVAGWMPHKRLVNDQVRKIKTERAALIVEPGRRKIPGGATECVGVPYGSRARLILLYLQSEALRTNSRDIELGRSLHDALDEWVCFGPLIAGVCPHFFASLPAEGSSAACNCSFRSPN